MAFVTAAGSPSSLEKPFHWGDNPSGLEFARIVLHASNDRNVRWHLLSGSSFQGKYNLDATAGHLSDGRHKIAILYFYFHDLFLSSEIGSVLIFFASWPIWVIHHPPPCLVKNDFAGVWGSLLPPAPLLSPFQPAIRQQ
jgi:hypothetical protein